MKKIAVTYHSGYGHTARQAKAVLEGAGSRAGVEAKLYDVTQLDEAAWAELDAADAIIFGAPTYMGSASAKFKEFMDASSKRWFAQAWKDKLFAGFTNSAGVQGDKQVTLDYLFHLAMQHGGIWVGNGIMPANSKAATRNDVNWIGSYSGAMAQSPSDASAAEMFPGDLETGRRLGQRVAQIAARLVLPV